MAADIVTCAVASGGQVLGRKVEAGPVLYLALEDPPRRLQERMQKQHWPPDPPADFLTMGKFAAAIGDLLTGGAVKLGLMIEQRGYRLVVVDTFSRAIRGDQMDVSEMTRALTPLQETAHKQNCCVLLNDHHRKVGLGGTPDVIADILGSTAKGAMADSILGLYRERGKPGARLAITGRDIGEQTLALTMAWDIGTWQCEGDAGALEMTDQRQAILDALAMLGRAKLKDITDATEQNKGSAYKRLADLLTAGLVKKDGQHYVLA